MPAEFFFPRGAEYWTPAGPGSPDLHWAPAVGRQSLERPECVLRPGPVEAERPSAPPRAETRVSSSERRGTQDRSRHHSYGSDAGPRRTSSAAPDRRCWLLMASWSRCSSRVSTWQACCSHEAPRGHGRWRSAPRSGPVAAFSRVNSSSRARWSRSPRVRRCGAAALTLDALVALSPADIPRLDATALDVRVLVFAITIAVTTTLLVGLAPARISAARRWSRAQRRRHRPVSWIEPGRTRRRLIAVQLAATLVLLVAAGLCINSFARLARLDLGFDPQRPDLHIGSCKRAIRPRRRDTTPLSSCSRGSNGFRKSLAAGAVFPPVRARADRDGHQRSCWKGKRTRCSRGPEPDAELGVGYRPITSARWAFAWCGGATSTAGTRRRRRRRDRERSDGGPRLAGPGSDWPAADDDTGPKSARASR